MYIPEKFKAKDESDFFAQIRENPFVCFVGPGISNISFCPVIVNEAGAIEFHLARANPHSEMLPSASEVALFGLGPHGYISPSWYESNTKVPTWNYSAAFALGSVEEMDHAALHEHLANLVSTFESGRPNPWRMEDMDQQSIDKLMHAIRGFRFTPSRYETKLKLGQNLDVSDVEGMVSGLENCDEPNGSSLLALAIRRANATVGE